MSKSKLLTSAKLAKIRNHSVKHVPNNTFDKKYSEDINYGEKYETSLTMHIYPSKLFTYIFEIFLSSHAASSYISSRKCQFHPPPQKKIDINPPAREEDE